jgi:hypothetical protein
MVGPPMIDGTHLVTASLDFCELRVGCWFVGLTVRDGSWLWVGRESANELSYIMNEKME